MVFMFTAPAVSDGIKLGQAFDDAGDSLIREAEAVFDSVNVR
jgi:hypothetical protein